MEKETTLIDAVHAKLSTNGRLCHHFDLEKRWYKVLGVKVKTTLIDSVYAQNSSSTDICVITLILISAGMGYWGLK